MSDRIYVMRDGEIIGELPGRSTSQEAIIHLIAEGGNHVAS